MLNTRMQSMFDDFKPVNDPTIVVKVELPCDSLVEDLAAILHAEMFRVAGPAGERQMDGIESEDIRKYLATLSFMRRAHVAGLNNNVTAAFRSFKRSIAVPFIWYQVMIGIGKAVDRDYSIEFIPGTTINEEDLLDPEQMRAISDLMFRLQNNGFGVVAGIPLAEEGELDFMAMCHVDGFVRSYRKTHPTYAFLASFFKSQEVSAALGALVRIRYGYDSDYRMLLSRVVSSVGGEG